MQMIHFLEQAKRQMEDATGLKPETVTSAFKDEEGWHVGVEMLEMTRIPTATDLLGNYEALLGDDGTLLKFARRATRLRGDVMEEEAA